MMNLFTSFNPITSQTTAINWIMMITPMSIMIVPYWSTNSIPLLMKKKMMNMISDQFKSSMKSIMLSNTMMVTTIMIMILTLNIMSMLPNTFPMTSHIMFNFSMALTMWVTLMMKKTNNKMKILATLTPMNTPPLLIPFMVMIELVSMMIQPMTLSIRLTANVTAGHIMMILISEMYQMSIGTALIMNLMMMLLELGVSMIQAYVFSMLIIMYKK